MQAGPTTKDAVFVLSKSPDDFCQKANDNLLKKYLEWSENIVTGGGTTYPMNTALKSYNQLKLIQNINLCQFRPGWVFFDFSPAIRYKFREHMSIHGSSSGSREDKNGSSGH